MRKWISILLITIYFLFLPVLAWGLKIDWDYGEITYSLEPIIGYSDYGSQPMFAALPSGGPPFHLTSPGDGWPIVGILNPQLPVQTATGEINPLTAIADPAKIGEGILGFGSAQFSLKMYYPVEIVYSGFVKSSSSSSPYASVMRASFDVLYTNDEDHTIRIVPSAGLFAYMALPDLPEGSFVAASIYTNDGMVMTAFASDRGLQCDYGGWTLVNVRTGRINDYTVYGLVEGTWLNGFELQPGESHSWYGAIDLIAYGPNSLITIIPIPSTILLMGLGFAGMGAFGLRKYLRI